MALAFTYPGAPPGFTSSSNVATYTNTTFVFVSGTLYVVGVYFDDAEATVEAPTSIALSGATPPTVTQVGGSSRIAKYNTVASPLFALSCWWFIGDGVTRTITLTQPDAGTGAIFHVCAITGADNTAPIVQSNHGTGNAGTTASTTLATFAQETNGGLIFVGHDTTNLITAEAGWTEGNSGTDLSHTTPAHRASWASIIGTDTTPSMTIAANSDWGCVAMEIAEAPAGSTTWPGWVGAGWW